MSATVLSHDILRRFPYDVWSKCILFAIDMAPEGPLLFLNVSSHWQKLLLDSPAVWSYIHVADGEDVAARIHTFLHLSHQHSLELAFTIHGPLWTALKPIILLHRERIRSISILGRDPAISAEHVADLLGGRPFPAVRTIHSNETSLRANIFKPLFTLCPNVNYCPKILFDDHDSNWVGEEVRTVWVTLEKTIPRLNDSGQRFLRLPRLERLVLNIEPTYPRDPMPPDSSQQSLNTSGTFVLSSKNLRYLRLDTSYPTALEGVLSSSFTLLTSMTITISPRLLYMVVQALPSLRSLRQWHLRLLECQTPWNSPSLKLSDVCQLRDFKLTQLKASSVKFSTVLNVLTDNDALCHVETAAFQLWHYTVRPTKLIDIHRMLHSVRNTRRLRLSFVQPVETTPSSDGHMEFPIYMPNIDSLSIVYSNLLGLIDAPNLLSLEILPRNNLESLELPERFVQNIINLEVEWEIFNSLKIQSNFPWNSVQNIKWSNSDSFTGSKMTSFWSIRSVHFVSKVFSKSYNPKNALNCFLTALLRRPDACPHLLVVKSDEYPIWELLFETLNQRNENKNLANLEEIWLPALPLRFLLSFVVELLKHNRIELIPRDIDNILSRRFQHQLIAACRHCIAAGYLHCAWNDVFPLLNSSYLWWEEMKDGSKHDRRSDQDYLELLELGRLQSLPDYRSGLKWDEWEDRLEEMSFGWGKWPKDIYRRPECIRHEFDGLVRIDKYSLDGIES